MSSFFLREITSEGFTEQEAPVVGKDEKIGQQGRLQSGQVDLHEQSQRFAER